MGYEAVVFDNDGVLVTPTRLSTLRSAMREAYAAVGVADPHPTAVEVLIGPESVGLLRSVAEQWGTDAESLWTARERAAVEHQRRDIREGKKERYPDVDALEALDRPTAVVSNNQHETVQFVLEYLDIDGPDPILGREPTLPGLRRKKPTPYYIERALEALATRDALYVGDRQKDVVAARAAGIDVAYIRREHNAEPPLEVEPTHAIDSLAELPGIV